MSTQASQATPRSRFARWWVPNISVCVWLVFFAVILLSERRHVLLDADGDPCWHWVQGNWMIEHRAILRADQWSHTRPGAPMVTKEWLSEIIFAAAGNCLGWNGIVLVTAALIATTLWLLHRQLLLEGDDLLLGTALTLVAAVSCSTHWLARPHLFTHLFTAVFVWQLRAFDRGRLPPAALFAWLVPAMVLWANLHGAFLTGFVLIGIYAAGNVLARDVKKFGIYVGLGATCLLVTLINPNGWDLHAHILGFLRNSSLVQSTSEWASPNFHSPEQAGFVLQWIVLLGTLVFVRPRLNWPDVLLLGGSSYLALQAVRNVPIFAIVVTPILAEQLTLAVREARAAGFAQCALRISANLKARHDATGGLALAAVTIVVLVWSLRPGQTWLVTEISPKQFPIKAVQFLSENREAVHGEMFNDYGWGGYLMLALPERKVFIDGRNDCYGADLVGEYGDVDDVKPNWDAIFQRHTIGWTILPTKHPLCRLLERRGDWVRVHEAGEAVIFSRTDDACGQDGR